MGEEITTAPETPTTPPPPPAKADGNGNGATSQAPQYVTVEQFKAVEQSILALTDFIKNGNHTPAEKMGAAEKQLEDAQRIADAKATLVESVPIFGTEKVSSNLILKDINELTPPAVAKQVINRAIGSLTDDERIHELQGWSDKIKIYSGLLKKRPHELTIFKDYERWLEKSGLGKAMSVAGSPANWIPEGWSGELLTFYQQRLRIASAFEMFEMPQDPFRWDFLGTGFTIYVRDEPTADPASKIRASDHAQDVITFSTSELAGRIVLARKLTEDALGAYVPTLRTNLIPRAMAEALERAILNGDATAGSHIDSALVTASDDVRQVYNGLRFIANRESATYDVQTGGSAFAYSDYSEVMLQGGQFAIEVDEGLWVMSNTTYIKTLAFDEVETMDKINLPTNINGVVNVVYGRPVIVSGEYPLTLAAATGLGTAGGNTTGFVYVNHDQFMIGFRREDEIEQDRDISTGQEIIVVTTRKDFQQMLPTGNTTVAAGFNVPT